MLVGVVQYMCVKTCVVQYMCVKMYNTCIQMWVDNAHHAVLSQHALRTQTLSFHPYTTNRNNYIQPLTILPPMISIPCPNYIPQLNANGSCAAVDRYTQNRNMPTYSLTVRPGQDLTALGEYIGLSVPAAGCKICCINNLQVRVCIGVVSVVTLVVAV